MRGHLNLNRELFREDWDIGLEFALGIENLSFYPSPRGTTPN